MKGTWKNWLFAMCPLAALPYDWVRALGFIPYGILGLAGVWALVGVLGRGWLVPAGAGVYLGMAALSILAGEADAAWVMTMRMVGIPALFFLVGAAADRGVYLMAWAAMTVAYGGTTLVFGVPSAQMDAMELAVLTNGSAVRGYLTP